MPSLYVRPVKVTEETGEDEKPEEKFVCPAFMNKARQVIAFHLPLSCQGKHHECVLSGAAIILDPGKSTQMHICNFCASFYIPLIVHIIAFDFKVSQRIALRNLELI